MPFKDPKREKEYRKEYREKNKIKLKNNSKIYYLKNKPKILEDAKQYRIKNHDSIIEYLNQWRKSHREENNQASKETYQKNKMLCLNHYSKGKIECKECKENKIAFMTIDHIKPRKEYGHNRETSSSALYRILKKDNFPSGYRVLCYNCNMIKEVKKRRKDKKSTNKATIRENRYGHKLKSDVMEKYSNGKPCCSCCGFDNIDGLSIDHKLGRKHHGHSRSFSSKIFYQFLKRENFPKGYQVLCINCNSAKGKIGKCPHKLDETI
ncbi:MAG: hypothetical protein ACW9XA_04875 [Candidatus Nitrosopumilus sp. bin_6a]